MRRELTTRKFFHVFCLSLAILFVSTNLPASAAVNGGKCAKVGQVLATKGVSYICVKSGKKLSGELRRLQRQPQQQQLQPKNMLLLLQPAQAPKTANSSKPALNAQNGETFSLHFLRSVATSSHLAHSKSHSCQSIGPTCLAKQTHSHEQPTK